MPKQALKRTQLRLNESDCDKVRAAFPNLNLSIVVRTLLHNLAARVEARPLNNIKGLDEAAAAIAQEVEL